MDNKKLKDHLKSALELEKTQFELQNIIANIQAKNYDNYTLKSLETASKVEPIGCGVGFGGAIAGFILGLMLANGNPGVGFFLAIVGGVGSWLVGKMIKDNQQEEIDNATDSRNAIIKKENNAIVNEAEKKNRMKKASVNEIQKALDDTNKKLAQLYSQNIIYPKYQNLIAVSSIYEYLDSGRCDSLDGPNGAYNIYEMEARLDKIITKIDLVISRLDQIMASQYYLYTAIKEIQPSIDKVTNAIISNTEKLNEVAVNTEATAYSAKVIEKTTKVIENNQYYERNWRNGITYSDRTNL